MAQSPCLATDPFKHPANNSRLFQDNLILCITAGTRLRDIAVSKRGGAHDRQRSAPGRVALPAARPFNNLGPFILCNHALYLKQEIVFRRLTEFVIQKDRLHSCLVELIDK
jgi:hypothetical protein